MQLIRGLPESLAQPTAVAIGNFDGFHRGHQAVIGAMKRAAEAYDLQPTILTFEPHPRRYFDPGLPPFRIERLRTKFARFMQEGVTLCVVPRFDAAFAAVTADAFMNEVLVKRLNAKVVVTGENFAFGYKRAGDSALLKRWGSYNDVDIILVPPVLVESVPCASSAIRVAVSKGDMKQAARMLGRAYMLSGRVAHGDGRGRKLGFPTANLALPDDLLLPAHGVYAVYAAIENVTYPAVANLGIRPTFGGNSRPQLEVHLLDFVQEIYGKTMRVFFSDFLRPEMTFDGIGSLALQIRKDCDQARQRLGGLA
jgi:riboflavin kinase/FMN adenylyltransferase